MNLHLLGEIEDAAFSAKNTEIRDRIAQYTLKLEAADRCRDEHADLARKAFKLSQTLSERWLTADYAAKRQMLEIVCLNFRLDGVSLVPEWRKPFDLLAEGLLVSSSRGDSPFTIVNETLPGHLLWLIVPQVITFTGDAITRYVERGKYANTRALRKAK